MATPALNTPDDKDIDIKVIYPPKLQPQIAIFLLSTYSNEPKYRAAAIWSCASAIPNLRYTDFVKASPRPPVPRPSTQATMKPLEVRYCSQSNDHLSRDRYIVP